MSAKRLVNILLSQFHQRIALGQAVGELGRTAAFDADGVHLLHIFGHSHKRRHRPERLAQKVCIQTGYDYSDS